MSDTGFNNDRISLEWVKHFGQQSRTMLKGTHRLLLFDGFDSHLTKEFLEVLEANKVIPYRLPPHATQLLQPLDVGCFQPYKHWHVEAVDAATRTGCTSFNKVEFLAALESVRRRTFKKRTIERGWREAGLIPYNPGIVLNKIRDDDVNAYEVIPQTPPASAGRNISEDLDPDRILSPIKTYRGFINHLQWLLLNEDASRSQNMRITLRGAYHIALAGENVLIQTRSMTAAAQARQECQKRNRRVLNSDMGVMRSDQARVMVKERIQLEFDKEIQKCLKERTKLRTAHRKAFTPIHRQLQLVWASMRAAGCFSYEEV